MEATSVEAALPSRHATEERHARAHATQTPLSTTKRGCCTYSFWRVLGLKPRQHRYKDLTIPRMLTAATNSYCRRFPSSPTYVRRPQLPPRVLEKNIRPVLSPPPPPRRSPTPFNLRGKFSFWMSNTAVTGDYNIGRYHHPCQTQQPERCRLKTRNIARVSALYGFSGQRSVNPMSCTSAL